jgi:hypothetical protein
MEELVSNCCSARPELYSDIDSRDLGICADCLEHCEYIEITNNQTKTQQNDNKN